MGLSSKKSRTTSQSTSTSAPSAAYSPYIDQALQGAQSVYIANQGNLQDISAKALEGFNAIAPQAFSPSPYVQQAKAAAGNIASGAYVGGNPGAATYRSLIEQQNPALASLQGLANGSTSPGDYSGIGSENPALAQYRALLNGGDNSAIGGLQRFADGTTGAVNPAAGYDSDVLAGKYLNSNPYLDAIAGQAAGAATKAANQRFGRTGLGAGLSSAYDSAVASSVADAENSLRYGAYNDERGRQDAASGRVSANYNTGQDRALSALGTLSSANNQRTQNALAAASGLGSTFSDQQRLQLSGQQARDAAFEADRAAQLSAATGLGSLFDQQQRTQLAGATAADSARQSDIAQQLQALGMTGSLEQAGYAGVDPALALLNASATAPYLGANAYASLVNGLTGRFGTQTGSGSGTTTSSPSLASQLGQGLQLGATIFSDRRLKTDIVKVGEMNDGLGVYDFSYVWGGRHRGVMADEVATLRPWALGPTVSGYATVNYGVL